MLATRQPSDAFADGSHGPSLGEGVHHIPADVYLADPCPKPSLSSHIAQILLDQSPGHAWLAHPRLNPDFGKDEQPDPRLDFGRAAHRLMLEGAAGFEIIDAPNWRSEAARDERLAAMREGKIALLEPEWQRLAAMMRAGRAQLRQHPEAKIAFKDGEGELTIIWKEGGIWCRIRPDWLHRRRRFIFDYKTTDGSAHPSVWGQRQLYEIGGDLQHSLYSLGAMRVLEPRGFQFRFIVQETRPPYALSVVALSRTAQDLARQRVSEAIRLWAACQRRDKWPGYPRRTAYVEPPPWYVRQVEDRHMQRELDRESGIDPFKLSVMLWKP